MSSNTVEISRADKTLPNVERCSCNRTVGNMAIPGQDAAYLEVSLSLCVQKERGLALAMSAASGEWFLRFKGPVIYSMYRLLMITV